MRPGSLTRIPPSSVISLTYALISEHVMDQSIVAAVYWRGRVSRRVRAIEATGVYYRSLEAPVSGCRPFMARRERVYLRP